MECDIKEKNNNPIVIDSISEDNQNHVQKLSFPSIPEGKRIIPNDLVRSSLFTVSNHNIKREYIKEKELFTFGGTRITYTGEELRQDDKDVWLQIIFLFSRTKMNFSNSEDCNIEFLPFTLIRELLWPARTQYRDKLKESLNRMSATNITISNKSLGQGITLSLIRKLEWKNDNDERLKEWKVWLEPELVKLFEGMCYSKILWGQRNKLNPLAKWLHSYYSSHSEPYAVKVTTIHAACGSKTREIKHFKPVLRDALVELTKVGFLEDFWIDMNNLVYVTRVKTPSQTRSNSYE